MPNVSNVIDMETMVSTAANVNEKSLQPISKKMQLQLSMQHIMTLTHHTQLLQMECHQLMTANTEYKNQQLFNVNVMSLVLKIRN